MKIKKCNRCGNEYIAKSATSLYCGSKIEKTGCAYLVRLEINRRSFDKHYYKDKVLYQEKVKQRRRKNRIIKPKIKKVLSEETKRKISATRILRKIPAPNKKPDTLCIICGKKVTRHSYKKCFDCYKLILGKERKGAKFSESHRKNISIAKIGKLTGNKAGGWKGGINKINKEKRRGVEITLWKEKCLIRDNYTCQKYNKRGGDLNVHHILNFSEYPELRTEINNGITLSKKAHELFHKIYGKKNNTKEQIEEFIGKKLF